MRTGRPLEFDPEQALASATMLFWEKGYETTSTVDLMQAMGLSKSSLYQTFGSKQELFLLCMEHYVKMVNDYLHQKLEETGSVKQFFFDILLENYIENDVGIPEGCLLVNSTCEFGDKHHDISPLLTVKMNGYRQVLQAAIELGQESGEVVKDKDSRQLAEYLLVVLSGLSVMRRLNNAPLTENGIVDQVMEIFV